MVYNTPWDQEQCSHTAVRTAHTHNVFAVAPLPRSNDTLVLTCGADGTLHLHPLLTKKTIKFCEEN